VLTRLQKSDARCLGTPVMKLRWPGHSEAPRSVDAGRLVAVVGLFCLLLVVGCWNLDTPHTNVALDNEYPASATVPLVIFQGYWQAVTFSTPILPGGSSGLQTTVPASDNTAYVVLAPGWDPQSSPQPTSFVVLQSRGGFAVALNHTLHIPVDDSTFDGNCAAGSTLTQSQADFITGITFPITFAGLAYDAATCTTRSVGDAGSE
jgi:hypothetical protein